MEIPKGSLLDPSDTAAVVGGNVLTSQRIVDVVFRAFSACAASQGCMNNTTFGDETVGYYETVTGEAGALLTFDHNCIWLRVGPQTCCGHPPLAEVKE